MKSNPIMTNQTSNDEQPMPAVTTTTTTTTTTTLTTTITTSTSSAEMEIDSSSNEQALLEAAFAKMRDQEEFFKRLVEFHKHKNVNTAIHKLPSVNGRTLDLRALYNRVVSAGGWERVCEKNRWSELAADLDPIAFKSCVNGAHALKLIYIRYLSVFEKFDQQTQYSANASKVNLQSLLDPLVNLNPVYQPSGTSSVMLNPALTGIPASYNNLLDLNGTDDTDINRRKFSHLIELAPMTYNHSQHSTTLNSTAALSSNNLFASPSSSPTSAATTTTTTKPVSWAFEPIMLSLLCGMPNEVDFVFNMLIHLSSDDKNPLKLAECERLVDLMLAHVGFFGANDKYQLRSLYDLVWNAPEFDQEEKENNNNDDADQDVKTSLIEKFARYGYSEFVNEYMSSLRKMRRRCFVLFWHNGVELPDKTSVIKSTAHASSNLRTLLESLLPKLYNTHLNEFPSPDLLNMREGDLVRSVEYRRLEQAMIILNNLSFDEINADMMANKSPGLFEFLIVATFFTSREPYVNLKRHSLDILANIAKKMRLKRLSTAHNSLLVGTLHQLIVDQEHDDRLDLIRALEILSKLCGRELGEDDSTSNEKILARYEIMNDVLSRMESLLTSQDVLVVLHALECLYNMTQCSRDLSPPQRLVPILVNFLTLDISHFGGQAVDNPVVNTYASTLVTNAHAAFQQQQQQQIYQQQQQIYQQQQQLPSQQPKIVQASVINGKTVIKTASPTPSVQLKPSTPNLLHQTLQQQHALNVNNQGSATTTTTTTTNTATATGLIKINTTAMPPLSPTATSPGSSTLSGKAEEEARNWLVTSFQPDRSSEISKTQLYAHYQHIAKIKGWTVLTIPTFFEILYVTFPNVRLNEETNKLTGIKLDPMTSRKPTNEKPLPSPVTSVALTTKTASPVVVVNTAGNSSDATKPTIVKKEDSSASPFSSLLSPPPTVSVSVYNQASPMALPLLTPPSPPPARSNTSVQHPSSSSSTSAPAAGQVPTKPIVNPAESTATSKENSGEDSKPVVNVNPEHSNTNSTAASLTNPSITEILNQNEDSTSSMSSSSSTMSSASTSSSKSSSSSSSLPAPTTISCAENANKRKLEDEVKQGENNPNQAEPVKAPSQPPTPVVESKPIEKSADTEMIDTSTTRAPTPMAVTTTSTDTEVLVKKHKPMDTITHVEPAVVKVPEFVNIGDYMCEWNGCNRMFPTSKAVYNHVCKYHLLNETNDVPSHGTFCRWSNGCDQVRRQKWSLVNHLMERHCNENAMRTAIICRQRGINQVLNHPTAFINYSPDAAQIAIQRNQKIRREDFYSCDEGPITKSIRLLAALSLRNLARNCEQSKKLIRTFEAELTNVAFDLLEASNALTNCLWYLQN